MTENVTVREPEVEQDQPTEDQPDRQPIRTADRAGQAAPSAPDAVTTADMAAAGDRAGAAPSASQPDAAPSPSQPAAAQARQRAAAQAEAEAVPEAPKTGARAATETEATPATETEARPATEAEAMAASGAAASLFPADQSSGYRSRWQEIQTGFVDEPRAAVQEADNLVAEVMRQLARTFADERRQLEAQWSEGEEISTEDLRLALRRYRSFFDRLLSV
jgi:hypothetical protein